jgi:hypothetical protein
MKFLNIFNSEMKNSWVGFEKGLALFVLLSFRFFFGQKEIIFMRKKRRM